MPRSSTAKNLLGGRFLDDEDLTPFHSKSGSISEGLCLHVPTVPSKLEAPENFRRPEITFSPPGDSSSQSDDDSMDEKQKPTYLSDQHLSSHRRFLSEKSDQM